MCGSLVATVRQKAVKQALWLDARHDGRRISVHPGRPLLSDRARRFFVVLPRIRDHLRRVSCDQTKVGASDHSHRVSHVAVNVT